MDRAPAALLAFSAAILLISGASARTTFGTGNGEPLPNVTSLSIYDVTGLSSTQKETGGVLEDSGINETFLVNQTDYWRTYRFSFEIRNDGDTTWDINDTDGDVMFHDNLDADWRVTKIWYNISQDYDSGTFQNGKVDWNTSKGGSLAPGETLYAKYLVNISLSSSNSYFQQFKVNETLENAGSYDYHTLDSNKLGFLNLTLEEPPNDTVVVQDEYYIHNVSVTCENGECGTVKVSPRYNESSTADTLVPENSGTPFHTNTSNVKTCDSSLLQDETCYSTWFVNASGTLESWHLLDGNASSSYSQVAGNDSEDHLVQVNKAILVDLSWNTTRFGVLDPGSQNNSALGNDNLAYNFTVDEYSKQVDELWVRSTDLNNLTSGYTIGATNLSYSDTNDIATEEFLSNSYQLAKTSLSPGSVVNFFFWLDIPTGIKKGGYNGTIYFKANSTR
ncbi:MAG: hypothetical protein ABEJ91_01120 [Candidatus Nanohaloarchaea archaeon]